MRQRNRGLLIVGVFAVAATGCELLVHFDRSKIDGGVTEVDASPDGELPDVQSTPDTGSDVASKDSGGDAADATTVDTGTPDAGEDTSAPDTGTEDTGTPDTGTADTGTPDTGTADSGTPDSGTPDTGTPDTGSPDTGPADTGAPDTGTPDTGAPDTGPPDTGAPDSGSGDDAGTDATTGADSGSDAGVDTGTDTGPTGCNSLSLNGVPVVTIADDSTDSPPALTGGTIPDGLFYLTAETFYMSTPSGKAGETEQEAAQTSSGGTVLNTVVAIPAPDQSTYAISLPSSTTLSLSNTCGDSLLGGPYEYAVVGSGGAGTLLLVSVDGVDVLTFTHQ